jgi:hypothetical protein
MKNEPALRLDVSLPVEGALRPPMRAFFGKPIRLSYLNLPRSARGRLVSGGHAGSALDGASFIRERRIVLSDALRGRPAEHRRILLHELFHFAWVRLGNRKRWSFEEVIRREMRAGLKGELGWPAFEAKGRLSTLDVRDRTPRWREYACESFCDTCAWVWQQPAQGRGWTRLAVQAQALRRRWVQRILVGAVKV